MASPPNYPLRSAMKASRPSTPTSVNAATTSSPSLSPHISRVPLPISPTSTLSHAQSVSSIRESHHLLRHPPLPHHAATSPAYTYKVSFDTFENPAASMFSFTLQVKAEGYKRSRNTRVYLCASSPDESGSEALEWCLESLVQDGDELIVFRGIDEDVFGTRYIVSSSRIVLRFTFSEKDHNVVREEAREFMRTIQARSVEFDPHRKLSFILEYIPGKITDSIDRLIALYRPDSVVVGTRGRRFAASLVQGLGVGLVPGAAIGSISK
jgi:nucleotide-binding universal stress UspA family protein